MSNETYVPQWERVGQTQLPSARTAYWKGSTPSGLRVAVSRTSTNTPGAAWSFTVYRPRHNGDEQVHESEAIGTVAQARAAAERWLAENGPALSGPSQEVNG